MTGKVLLFNDKTAPFCFRIIIPGNILHSTNNNIWIDTGRIFLQGITDADGLLKKDRSFFEKRFDI